MHRWFGIHNNTSSCISIINICHVTGYSALVVRRHIGICCTCVPHLHRTLYEPGQASGIATIGAHDLILIHLEHLSATEKSIRFHVINKHEQASISFQWSGRRFHVPLPSNPNRMQGRTVSGAGKNQFPSKWYISMSTAPHHIHTRCVCVAMWVWKYVGRPPPQTFDYI